MPFAAIDVSNTTAQAVATPDNSQDRVRLTGGFLTSNATTTVTFRSGTTNTVLAGPMTFVAGTPLVLPISPFSPGGGRRPGYLQTPANEALQIVLGTANTRVTGSLEYIFVGE